MMGRMCMICMIKKIAAKRRAALPHSLLPSCISCISCVSSKSCFFGVHDQILSLYRHQFSEHKFALNVFSLEQVVPFASSTRALGGSLATSALLFWAIMPPPSACSSFAELPEGFGSPTSRVATWCYTTPRTVSRLL